VSVPGQFSPGGFIVPMNGRLLKAVLVDGVDEQGIGPLRRDLCPLYIVI
jgi:hypothetical protein